MGIYLSIYTLYKNLLWRCEVILAILLLPKQSHIHIHITGGAGKNERHIPHLDKIISEKGINLKWTQTLFYISVGFLFIAKPFYKPHLDLKNDVSNVYFILIQFVNKDHHHIFKMKKNKK